MRATLSIVSGPHWQELPNLSMYSVNSLLITHSTLLTFPKMYNYVNLNSIADLNEVHLVQMNQWRLLAT